ncbi:MAG: hypothetical protein A3B30_02870 [Candidatus Komeilibacteria bacterium RIFCSPLOWO2_01_FULL_52_15]|uniref:ABC transporter ATP-binding protein n=2 Tax=Candidatus Komeiliibacteriota TaxID=1817908 RepID=A0A1G2BTA2_9BACT|nr:MAG: hypothetical protein A2677_02345 [Candidatus Komeilibacteria bacterium RIFCSPHIGHO2_01_FULL_52_14]OGY91467.1 MAG: hypothetical protein A3B30_02870 [Candidatus Komeilibacteria bacterium RIFCSPLOWO2_01_FULL_52_15]
MKYKTKKTFQIFYAHVRRYRLSVVLVFFTICVASALDLIVPLLYRELINVIAGETQVVSVQNAAVGLLIAILGFYLVAWVFWRIASFASVHLQTRVMTDLANRCFQYIHRHSTSFFNSTFVGSLVRRVGRFSRAFETIADIILWDLTGIIVSIVMVASVLAYRNRYLGLAILVWIIIYVSANYLFSRYKLKLDTARSMQDSRVTGVLADTITNQQNIKFFTGYRNEVDNFAHETDTLRKMRFKAWSVENVFEAGQILLMIFMEVGVMYLAFRLWLRGIITVGDFVLIQSYLFSVITRLWNVGRMIRRFYEALAEAEEMTEILDTPHEITDAKSTHVLQVSDGRIEFRSVSFSYQKTRRVLSDITFVIAPRERLAIVGSSGSGKSTVVNLLLRNYDVESGKIFIDGENIRSVTLDSLWKNISVVSQDAILFHRSIIENIRYGKPDATDAEVAAAAQLAQAHDFITRFPDGYETYVGERGIKLSGGERQRIAIARAILKNAPILVLDEATSSLDSESEHLIQKALAALMKNKTVIVIAHRLSTIMQMDRILVIADGKIVEEGSHQELAARKIGIYKSLWERQVGGFIAPR